jgi:FtsH-binding integral membrane protein
MNTYESSNDNQTVLINPDAVGTIRAFMARVFTWMTAALLITALVAYLFAANASLFSLLYTETGLSVFGWVVMFAPLAFVFAISFGINRFSTPVMAILFILYSIVMGMSMSFIFYVFTLSSIYITFLITAGVFGLMAILGYTTKLDLTRFGTIMLIGLIGIIIASLVNFFMKSAMMDYVISIAGVVIFTGLTAYDVQKLKRIGMGVNMGDASTSKLAIMGALSLYLDFINLFMFLLRLFGSRK